MLTTSEKTKEIDDSLKKVLFNPKMNDHDKWSLYRHKQFHLADIKRKNNYGLKPPTLRKNIKGSKSSTDVSTNTKRKVTKTAETDMQGFVSSKNAQTQSDVASSGALPEKIYENSFYESFSEPNNMHDANAEAETEYDVNNQTLRFSFWGISISASVPSLNSYSLNRFGSRDWSTEIIRTFLGFPSIA